jgi:hypothetical protein
MVWMNGTRPLFFGKQLHNIKLGKGYKYRRGTSSPFYKAQGWLHDCMIAQRWETMSTQESC